MLLRVAQKVCAILFVLHYSLNEKGKTSTELCGESWQDVQSWED
jgi:hypothetical protein